LPLTAAGSKWHCDIALISEEIQQAQALLQRVEEASASVGLAMNANKTKILAFNQKTGGNHSHRWFAVRGNSRLQVPGLNDEQHRG